MWAALIFRQVISLGKEFTHIAQVNSAFHPSVVDKSSTSFDWVMVEMITSVGWQVALCDPIDMRVPVVVRCLA